MRILSLFMAASLLVGVSTAGAVVISIDPPTSAVEQGTSIDIDLVISGLGASGAPSLGAFAVDIGFDGGVLAFDSVAYSAFLGDPGVDTDVFTTPGVGTVQLDNFSLLSDTDLDVLQDASFLLATLTFSGLAVGTSALDITPVDIATAAGDDITVNVDVVNGSTEVQPGTAPVPATYLLMLPALLAGALRRRRGAINYIVRLIRLILSNVHDRTSATANDEHIGQYSAQRAADGFPRGEAVQEFCVGRVSAA